MSDNSNLYCRLIMPKKQNKINKKYTKSKKLVFFIADYSFLNYC